MKTKRKNLWMMAAVLAGGWLLAACSSDDASSQPHNPEPSPTPAETVDYTVMLYTRQDEQRKAPRMRGAFLIYR